MNSHELGLETVEITQHVGEVPAKRGQNIAQTTWNIICAAYFNMICLQEELNTHRRKVEKFIPPLGFSTQFSYL